MSTFIYCSLNFVATYSWQRTAKAMKPFGISAETVKSALKCVLVAYEKNWTYIEEDNYNVLIEAIF